MNLKRPTNGREATMIDPFWPDQLFPQLFLGSIHFSKHKAITSCSALLGGLGSSPPSLTNCRCLFFPIGFSELCTTSFCCLPCQPRVSILSIRYRSVPTAYVSCNTVRSADRKNTLTLIREPGHPTLPVAARCWPVFVFVLALFPHVSQFPSSPIPRAQSFPALYTAHPQVVFPRPAFVSIMTHI